MIQSRGTTRVGMLFGPVMVVWFVTIGVLGLTWIVREPRVLAAFNPLHAADVLPCRTAGTGSSCSAPSFSCVTGGEALYADMGHFGRKPIRLAWFSIVLPALFLNYLGQGAMILLDPAGGIIAVLSDGAALGAAIRSSCSRRWRPSSRRRR